LENRPQDCRDPRSCAGALAVLGTTVIVASTIPARRATRVDPITVLRPE